MAPLVTQVEVLKLKQHHKQLATCIAFVIEAGVASWGKQSAVCYALWHIQHKHSLV